MVLKDESNGMSSQTGECMVIKLRRFFAIDPQCALGGAIQQANDVEQGALART